MADDPMWLVVMFDLPVVTKAQRRAATQYRNRLLDCGFSMVQFSVYARYRPTGGTDVPVMNAVTRGIPAGGKVRVMTVTDKQWSSMMRFSNNKEETEPETPEQLTIF
ncbi:CRISPR-associated endoribonuclease Cas2 [Gleimia coleocanis DSM 15436]|uniref:CRISPR-associated endoribonuclease Cas2 n=1 Tax=Gleimia coleocanis DSM 15436 TaxID=525245 RepID=C0W0W6_9ACTO|nr:CRISPR-associated endonuclease Cas2 [Gleimia coleocanis]EEH63690.1 CRISPR-associated endoribonuclease Cas2 [Gleimia coleocanis DSM 15436]